MTKVLGIVGAVVFVAAVVLGHFAGLEGAGVIEIAGAAFALCASCAAITRKARERGAKKAVAVGSVALACVAGVLCCIGGLSQSVFAEISGIALALLTVIFGLVYANKNQEEKK